MHETCTKDDTQKTIRQHVKAFPRVIQSHLNKGHACGFKSLVCLELLSVRSTKSPWFYQGRNVAQESNSANECQCTWRDLSKPQDYILYVGESERLPVRHVGEDSDVLSTDGKWCSYIPVQLLFPKDFWHDGFGVFTWTAWATVGEVSEQLFDSRIQEQWGGK